MDKHLLTFDGMAKLVFGPTASVSGQLGTSRGPGIIRIDLDGRQLGAGPTFAEALTAAQRHAAELAEAPAVASG
jgi:hypothetical protein